MATVLSLKKKEGNDFRFYIASSGSYKVVRMVNKKEQVIKKMDDNLARKNRKFKIEYFKSKKRRQLLQILYQ